MTFSDNLKPVTPAISEIKTGTPGIKLGNAYIVGGIGGNFIPGSGGVPVLSIGSVTTLPAGSSATAELVSSGANTYFLNLGIPQGPAGEPPVVSATETVSSLTSGAIVVSNSAFPAGLVTNQGTVYPLEKGTVTYSSGTWTIDPAAYLAYDGVSSFTGPWTVFFTGGFSGVAPESSSMDQNPIMESRGVFVISSGAIISSGMSIGGLLVNEAELYIRAYNDGILFGCAAGSSGAISIRSGGSASYTTINDKGSMYVSDGSIVDNTIISSTGWMFVQGGTINSTTMNGGYMWISGGTANSITVNSGFLAVYSGGIVDSITVSSGAHLTVASGGTATNVISSAGALVSSASGATVSYV